MFERGLNCTFPCGIFCGGRGRNCINGLRMFNGGGISAREKSGIGVSGIRFWHGATLRPMAKGVTFLSSSVTSLPWPTISDPNRKQKKGYVGSKYISVYIFA